MGQEGEKTKYLRPLWVGCLLGILQCLACPLWGHVPDFLFVPVNTSQGLSENQVRAITQLSDGRMVFATSGHINFYDGTHFTTLQRSPGDEYVLRRYSGFYHLYLENDSLLWVKDHRRLQCVDLRRECYVASLAARFAGWDLPGEVEDLFVDHYGRVWLVCVGESVRLVCAAGGYSFPLPPDKGNLQDLECEENSLYLFYDTGVMACHDLPDGQLVYEAAAYPESDYALFSNTSLVVRHGGDFYQLRNGKKGGLFRFDRQTRSWQKWMEQDYALNTLMITDDAKAYISCARGFWIIDIGNGTRNYLPLFPSAEGDVLATEVSTVFQDRQGALWLGTLDRGLFYYHPALYRLRLTGRAAFPVSREEDVAVLAFAEDESGNLYLRTRTQAYRLSTSDDGEQERLLPVGADALPASVAQRLYASSSSNYRGRNYVALCTDSRGWVWAGTSDGLELYTAPDEEPRRFGREDGLANNFVQAILEDARHDIWVTTSNGISQVIVASDDADDATLRFVNYNQKDGALSGEYMPGAAYRMTDGTLCLGGVDGFNRLSPDRDWASPGLPYPPLFTALYLRGEKVRSGELKDGRLLLPQAPSCTKEIVLAYDQNYVTFEFSAMDYFNSGRTCYRYRLEGMERQWNVVLPRQQEKGVLQAAYTHLPPGHYTLFVQASDRPDVWTEKQQTALRLLVLAPWWQTPMAYTLYIIGISLLLFFSFWIYRSRLRGEQERRQKEAVLLQRIRDLIEQCDRYEADRQAQQQENAADAAVADMEGVASSVSTEGMSEPDARFLSHAIELVEKNLHIPGYSVEQLSRDLCMERTGLYRKLVALLDQSPSLFIRGIRLRRAAQLISEGRLSMAEIADCTGFSSSSYLSKCFQEMYGCRPSEYARKKRKST